MFKFLRQPTRQAELDKQGLEIFKEMILRWAAMYNPNGDNDKIMKEILQSALLIRKNQIIEAMLRDE